MRLLALRLTPVQPRRAGRMLVEAPLVVVSEESLRLKKKVPFEVGVQRCPSQPLRRFAHTVLGVSHSVSPLIVCVHETSCIPPHIPCHLFERRQRFRGARSTRLRVCATRSRWYTSLATYRIKSYLRQMIRPSQRCCWPGRIGKETWSESAKILAVCNLRPI